MAGRGADRRRFTQRLLIKRLFSIVAVLAVVACSYIAPVDQEKSKSWLPFIIDGRTTKEEVVTRLETPISQYENGRVVTYILYEDSNGRLELYSLDNNPKVYNLVLVFGPTEILEKHSLLRVK